MVSHHLLQTKLTSSLLPHFCNAKCRSGATYVFICVLCPCPPCTGSRVFLIRINCIYRSGTKKGTELETNTIDRATANLMFNKLDFNVQDHPLATSTNAKHTMFGSMGPPDCKLYESQVHRSNSSLAPPKDAEVPILGEQDPCTMMNLDSGFPIEVGGNNKSLVLNFGFTSE